MTQTPDEHWSTQGQDDGPARQPTVPAFLEDAPSKSRPVDEYSADELAEESQLRLIQARTLMYRAGLLPPAEGDQLLVRAMALIDESGRLLDMAVQRRRSESADSR